jgi:hypothetical protein
LNYFLAREIKDERADLARPGRDVARIAALHTA